VRLPLSLAVAQPRCVPGDARANGLIHAEAVMAAGARVIVFPGDELTVFGELLARAGLMPGDFAQATLI
jgi:hypothetical protein